MRSNPCFKSCPVSGSKNAVFLKDGSLKEGYITEIIPGEFVKMELESGEDLVVQMSDIDP
jgi:hypothetical protein